MSKIDNEKIKARGFLKVNIIDAHTKKIKEQRELGENLVVNNAKLILTHLIGQAPSQETGLLQNVRGFDPRISNADGGGIQGGVPIEGSGFDPTTSQLRLLYMAFGTNVVDGNEGPAPDLSQYGLFNAVSKNGYTVNPNPTDFSVSNFFYGGTGENPTIYQYLRSEASQPEDEVSDGIIRIITRMKTQEGQTTGGQTEYREAGLFTSLFYPHTATNGGEQNVPIMFARKTFSTITKTEDLELEFIWEIRF